MGDNERSDDTDQAQAEGPLHVWIAPPAERAQYQAYLTIEETSKRLREKIEAEVDVHRSADPHRRWRQLDDGTWVSDASIQHGPVGWVVVVERQHPFDKPIIHIVGRTQDLDPGAARWASLRLAEAALIAETGMLP